MILLVCLQDWIKTLTECVSVRDDSRVTDKVGKQKHAFSCTINHHYYSLEINSQLVLNFCEVSYWNIFNRY